MHKKIKVHFLLSMVLSYDMSYVFSYFLFLSDIVFKLSSVKVSLKYSETVENCFIMYPSRMFFPCC